MMTEENGYLQYQSKTSPESLFRVSVQPSASDSAQTPPSPVLYSKARLSRSTTRSSHPSKSHRSSRRSDSHRSASTAPTPQFKQERERQLANVPRDTLLQHTISKEYELREAKHLLTTALIQLEAIREKVIHEHDIRLALEDEKREQAVKTTKTLIDSQQDAMDAKEEVRRFQLQLDNAQTELHKVRDVVHQLESDKTDLERELVRARDSARTFKEQNALLHASEEGRREGFEEGLRQGRAMHGIVDLSQTSHLPPTEESNAKASNKPSHERPSSRPKSTVDHAHSLDTEIELRKIAERDNYRLNLQVTQLSRELDQQRQKTKEIDADRKNLADETGRLKRLLRTKDEEIARLTERRAALGKELQTLERKGRESIARKEAQVDELKAQVGKLSTDNEKLQNEKEDARRQMKEKEDAERRIKEELEKEKERREKESIPGPSTEQRMSYIPMPPPPIPLNIPTSGPLPRAPSSGSGSVRLQARRRFSVGSQSSTGSAPIEMPQSPAGRLHVIPETDDAGTNASSYSGLPHPSFPQPSIPQIIPPSQSSRVVPPSNPQFLLPSGNYMYSLPGGRLSNGSQSSIQINVEPPSRSPSSIDHQEVESGAFLSPNSRPVPLPSTQETPLPVLPRNGRNSNSTSSYEYEASGKTTQSNSPVIPGVTVPMPRPPSRGVPMNGPSPVIDGPLPPGFVPQTITNSNGISTPIWPSSTLPSGGSLVGPPQPPHSAATSRSGPIYGNPLNKDREDENDSYIPFSPYGPSSRPAGPTRPNGSRPGMTPATSTRDLPGSVIPGANMGPRSGVSIYAPAAPPMENSSWGFSSGPVIPGPLPHEAPSPEDDENDDVDSETALNTRINAAIGKRVIPPPVQQEFVRGPGSTSGYPNWRR